MILAELVFLKKYVIPATNRSMVICVANALMMIAPNVYTATTLSITIISVKSVKTVAFNVRTARGCVRNVILKVMVCHWLKEFVIIAVNLMLVCNVTTQTVQNVTNLITLLMGKGTASPVKRIVKNVAVLVNAVGAQIGTMVIS